MYNEAMFIIYVKDQEKSKKFYESLLKLSPRLHVPGMTEFQVSETTVLGLMPEEGIARILGSKITHPKESNGASRCELYLYVDNPDEYLDRLVELGGKEISKGEIRNWGDYVSYGLDLDGHVVAFAKRD